MPHQQIIRYNPPGLLDRWKEQVRSLWLGPYNTKDRTLARYFGGQPTSTGVYITEDTALNYAAVWAAVSIISSDVASLPLIFYKKIKGGGKERYTDHPLYTILHDQPNPEMTSMVFRETLQAHLLTWGNAYAEIERDQAGRVKALWPMLPSVVTVFRDERDMRLRYRVPGANGGDVFFEASEVLHIPGLGWDGTRGYSVIHQARESLGLLAASERFGGKFFGEGATFGGILTHPKTLVGKAPENLRQSINTQHQGVEKAHRFLILEEGMTYTKLGVDPNDAQFLETRKFQINEVARWFSIPPHKLADLERATFSNIEEQNIDYVAQTLRKWLVRWEQEIRRKLISPIERNIQDVEHLIEGLLRGKTAERYAAYAVGRQWGWLSADDIRELENQNPLPDGAGQIYLVPQNMAPADRIDEIVDKQVEPEPKPEPPAESKQDNSEQVEAQARTIAELRKQLEACGLEAEQHIGVIAAQRDELTAASETHVGLGAEIARLGAEREGLRAELAAVSAELEGSKAGGVQLVQELGAVKTELVKADGSLADVRGRYEAVVEALETRGGAIVRLTSDLDARSQQLQEAEARTAALTQERDEARSAALQAELMCSALSETSKKERREHEAARKELSDDLEVRSQQLRDAEALLEQAKRDRETDSVARAEAEHARQVAEAAAETARQAAQEATNAHTLASARADAAEAARLAVQEAAAARLTALITASRVVLIDAMGRMVRREADQVKRKRATPEKLRTWAKSFYNDYEADLWVDAMLPAITLRLALVDSKEDPAEVTRGLVKAHMETSLRHVMAAVDADPSEYEDALARMLQRWEMFRPAAFADEFVREEIAHVRSIV